MRIIECTEAEHGDAILAILNEAIISSTALYDYHPRPRESMRTWFETKRAKGFPVFGAIDEVGALLGFASYGTFRAFPAYKYTVEHSVYVDRERRGSGVGVALMRGLIERGIAEGVVGVADAALATAFAQGPLLFTAQSVVYRAVKPPLSDWAAEIHRATLRAISSKSL